MITVQAAAIRDAGGKVWSVPRPGRHHDVIRHMGVELDWKKGDPPVTKDACQGFVLSDGRFVDRLEAMKVARTAGQVTGPTNSDALFSEDLW